jgi:serine/threonine-protein kinase
MQDPPFKHFGKYEIQAQLGRGGFGTVFRAFDPTVGRLVAIKILVSESRTDLVTRFRNEAMAAGNLRHENIVTIYDFGEDNGVPFIAMEYLEGEDLQQALASGRSLSLLEKVSIMTQAAAGLDCAHRHGVVHRDVKPANIRLLPDGTVKIMDFGIARLVRDSGAARLTRQGHVLGTLLYMAPEQVMGSETDALCDIFAYGVTCYELLTGRHPFEAEDPRSVFYKITSEDPELIHHLVPNCPETLDHVIRRALHKDRELRYQTLRDLRVDIEPVLIALRKERSAALVSDARTLAGERDFERALSLLNEAIDLDAANQAARQLRDAVQVELRRRLVRPRIEAMLGKADQSLAEGNYNDAVQTLESALRLDPDDAMLQARSRDAQQQRHQTRESQRLVAEARADLAEGNLAAALHKASEAVALNSKSVDGRSLLEIVQLEMKKRDRQLRLNERLKQAHELLLLNAFDEAYVAMNALEPDEREAPEAAELLARLTAQKAEYQRQERLRVELTSAREFLDHGQFVEAVELLQRMRAEYPGEPRVDGLLSYAQQELAAMEKAQAIQSLQGEVLTCAEVKRFGEAIELLGSAISRYPNESGILRLQDTVVAARTAWERQQRVEQTVRECEAFADQGRFDEALVALRETRRKYPDDTLLDALQYRLDAGREKARREKAVLDVLGLSGRLVEESRPEAAVVELEAALAQFADERLQFALSDAREAVALKRRAALLEEIDRQVQLHIEKHEFDRALQVVDRASGSLAGDPVLTRLQAAALSAKAAWERDEAIETARNAAQALLAQHRLDEALAVLRACLEKFPDSWELARLDAELKVRAAVQEAETLAEHGDHEAAVELLRQAASRFPDETEIRAALVRAEEALRKWQRDRAIEEAARKARELTRAEEFERALVVVDAVAILWPGQTELENLRGEIIASQSAKARELEIAAAEQEILTLSSEGRFAEAVELAKEALTKFPDESALLSAKRTADEGWEQQQRAESIQRSIQRAEECLAGNQPAKGIKLLQNAHTLYGPDAEIDRALARAGEALRAELRAAAIQSAVEKADVLIRDRRADDALAALERARVEHGESTELNRALERVRDAVTAQRREESLAGIESAVRASLLSHDFAEAFAALDAAQLAWPGEDRLDRLRAQVSSTRAEWAVEQEIAAVVRACEDLCAAEKYEEARDAAEAALRLYPEAASLAAAWQAALEGLERRNRASEIAKCIADAAEFTAAGEPAMAKELLSGLLNRLGPDPELSAALAEAEIAIQVQRALAETAKGRFAEAFAILDSVEREYGANETVVRVRESVSAAQREWNAHAEAIRFAVQKADRLVENDDPAAAIAALKIAIAELGDAVELRSALERAQKAERDLDAQRERKAALQRELQQCAELIAAGKLAEAGRALQNAMRDYPNEPDLIATQQRLRTEWDRRRRTEATRRAADNARALLDQGQPARAVELLEAAAAQYPDDPVVRDALVHARRAQGEQRKAEVESVCRETRVYLDQKEFDRALETVELNLKALTGEPRLVKLRQRVIAARRTFEREAARTRLAPAAQAVTDEVPIAPPTREAEIEAVVSHAERHHAAPPIADRQEVTPPLRAVAVRWRKPALAGAGCVLALAAMLLGTRLFRPGATSAMLEVESQPDGATVKVGDRTCVTPNCRLDLPPGNYQVDAKLPGYAAKTEAVSIRRNEAPHVQLTLVPLPTTLIVTSNFTTGSIYVDDVAAGDLKDGQFTLAKLQPGLHRVKIAGPDGEASMSFKTAAASAPELHGEIAARDADAIVITSLGSTIRAECPGCQGSLAVDGKRVEGKTIATGAHELTARTGAGQTERVLFQTGDAPAIAIHLTSKAGSAGTLVVETNVDGASVLIDRHGVSRQTEAGRLVIPLEPRDYRIEVHKQGYHVSPERLIARVKKGDQFRATFRLDPYPATLAISGLADGASVTIDGSPAGAVRGGSFSIAVSPGAHTVTLAREGFRTASAQRSFEPGETVRLDNTTLHLDPLPQPPKPAPQPVAPAPKPPQPTPEEIEAGEWASARTGRDPVAIQAFLQRHPETVHRQEAQQLLAQIEWDSLDRNDRGALEHFASRHRGTPLAAQAAADIARLEHEAAAAASRTAEQQVAADRSQILKVLATYAAAFETKDLPLLKSVWPAAPENLAQALRGKGVIRSQLRPLALAEITGDGATVHCTRITEQITQFGRQKPVEEIRTVHLHKQDGRWIISGID